MLSNKEDVLKLISPSGIEINRKAAVAKAKVVQIFSKPEVLRFVKNLEDGIEKIIR